MVGGSLGTLVGWLIAFPSHSSMFWPIGFALVLVLSSIAWW